jgi:hypothetical protein
MKTTGATSLSPAQSEQVSIGADVDLGLAAATRAIDTALLDGLSFK